ncbi:HlyD family efflux transporter periplasmic adaptor subunit [Desulfomicrobium escambiense]|uniref:HlyD family efflux transporter periplasmic adaptor subunit n=1 Tax=Desulfomicrobium escambiense TaxID=29503 RepID=UPI0004196EAE|nr:HlyD family efflux transporter periplasmic adaptor subunit [Desulfomicrobium escambiense]
MSSNNTIQGSAPADAAQALPWAEFSSASSTREYCQGWIGLQSAMIPGVIQGILVTAGEDGQFTPAAVWPYGGADPVRLADALERVIEDGRGLVLELDAADRYAMVYPVRVDGRLFAVVAMELAAEGEADLNRAMEQLQWGSSWLELLLRRQEADEDKARLLRLGTAVDMLALTLDRSSCGEAAMTFVTELAAASGCERVSLGLVRGRSVTLEAVSHSAEVNLKMNLTRAIERVMDEALLQRREIVHPSDDATLICREHEALSRQQGMASVVTLPLYGQGRYYGALTAERGADQPFTERDVEFFRAVAALVGPILEARRQAGLSLAEYLRASLRQAAGRLFGPLHYGRKLALGGIVCLALFLFFAEGEYRLRADLALEGAVRRAVTVPFDGFIQQAQRRAGDMVGEGDLLCRLDDRDLRLDRMVTASRYRQLEQQYQEAMSVHDRAQSSIVRAQLEQVQAELDLADAKLARTSLTAPFPGLIVSGDLSQRLGSAVRQGDVLFELTPLDSYRVILKVDERRIADVREGQRGELVLFSLPGQEYRFTVTKVTPIAKAEEGRNFFRVEAALDSVDATLRPGMEGVAKVDVDRRRLAGIWVRDMREWLTLFFWKWLP